MKTAVVASAFSVCLMLSPMSALAHGGAQGVVKQRMDQMDEMKDAVKAISAMLKGRSAYDQGEMRALATTLQQRSGDALVKLFPEGSLQKPSEALPVVWQEWDRFERLAGEQEMLSQRLLDALSADSAEKASADTLKAFKALSSNCKQCHDQYRAED